MIPSSRTFKASLIAFCLAALVVVAPVAAQGKGAPVAAEFSAPEPAALHLKTGKVDLSRELSLHAAQAGPLAKAGHYVLQLDGPLNPDRLAALNAAGIELGQYLPMHSYIVRLEAGDHPAQMLGGLDFVRWVGPFDKSWKLSPEIGQPIYQTAERIELAHQGILKLTVALFEGEDINAAEGALAAMPGVTVLDKSMSGDVGLIEITIPQGNYTALADLESVQWVEEAGEATYRNDTNGWILQSNISNVRSIWDKGIRGEGQVGGHIDGAVRQTHCSFTDTNKIVAYFGSTGSDSHGTHTAGTFVGDERPGNGIGFRGMAYRAKLAFTNLSSVTSTNLLSKFVQDHNAGASVHSNSWGNDGTTAYTAWSRDIDIFSFNNENDLVLFAVTNINGAVRTPENAKNCLAVAACTDTPANSHCSGGFGPTQDGRQKPELMAPGCSTISSQSTTTCGFVGSGFTGTSMACPAVAGAGLLVRQYFVDGFYPTGVANAVNSITPSGALIRATLINSGVDVTNIAGFPSTREGNGRVLLDNALYFAGENRNLIVLADIRNAQGLTTGQELVFRFSCLNNIHPVKVTLVWTEKEAALNANPAYINNLDLQVRAPNQQTYLGNVITNGQSTTGGTADIRNNVEQAMFNTPMVGRYTVTVKATAVNTATPQGFALIATGPITDQVTPTETIIEPVSPQ